MSYYLQHPDYTGNDVHVIGETEEEAQEELKGRYKLNRMQIFNFMYEGHIYRDPANDEERERVAKLFKR